MSRSDAIWYEDLSVLARRPFEFFPAKDQSPEEFTNALIRLVVYATLMVFVYNRNIKSMWYGLGAVVTVTLLFRGRGGVLAGLKNTYGKTKKYREPTPENPFGNMLVSEYGKTMPPPPQEYDDSKAKTEEYFNKGLFRDMDDIYDTNNSQRQFMTVPNGGRPPDLVEFAKFLGKDMVGKCKGDTAYCRGSFP